MAVKTQLPKHFDRPHYEVNIPDEVHQFDLLHMPSDTLYRNKHKYIVLGIDVASRYKVARPMGTKQAADLAHIIVSIYKAGPLTYPKIFQCNSRSEFKVEITKMLQKHGVKIQCTTTKYMHTHMAFVEALNKLLEEQLFKVQDAQKFNNPEKVSSTWVKYLYGLVDQLNDTEMQMIGMPLKDAIKLAEAPLVENYAPEDTLPEDGLYYYLLQPSEEHNDQRKRAMDRIWSKKTYRLSKLCQVKVIG